MNTHLPLFERHYPPTLYYNSVSRNLRVFGSLLGTYYYDLDHIKDNL